MTTKNEDLTELNVKIDQALRIKHEDCYELAREKDGLEIQIRKYQEIED